MKKIVTIVLVVALVLGIMISITTANPNKVYIDVKAISSKDTMVLENELKEIEKERSKLSKERSDKYEDSAPIYPKQGRLSVLDEYSVQYTKEIRKREMCSILTEAYLLELEDNIQFNLKYAATPEGDPDGRQQLVLSTALVLLSKLKESVHNSKKSDLELYIEYEIFDEAWVVESTIFYQGATDSKGEGDRLLQRISDPDYTLYDFADEFDIQIDML